MRRNEKEWESERMVRRNEREEEREALECPGLLHGSIELSDNRTWLRCMAVIGLFGPVQLHRPVVHAPNEGSGVFLSSLACNGPVFPEQPMWLRLSSNSCAIVCTLLESCWD